MVKLRERRLAIAAPNGRSRANRMDDCTELRGIRYRVLPMTRGKHARMVDLGGACRYTYNAFRRLNKREYEWHKAAEGFGMTYPKPATSYYAFCARFPEFRRQHSWMMELPFAPVREALRDLSNAYTRFFASLEDGAVPVGYPKPRRWGNDRFRLANPSIKGEWMRVPRIGLVKLVRRGGNPYPEGRPISATVRQAGNRWYATVTYEIPAQPRNANGHAIGVDANVGQVADSDGTIHRGPDVKKLEFRRRRYQRQMARQLRTNGKHSNRRGVTKRKLRKTERKLRGALKNWQHQTSRTLADKAEVIAIEDLHILGMTRSAKGTADAPGTNVKAKAGLNRSILNTGWGRLYDYIEYKAARTIRVPAPYTSQACNACGAIDAANRRSQAKFECVHCGHTDNADVNAALNILASGTGATGRGGGEVTRPVKRQTGTDPPMAA